MTVLKLKKNLSLILALAAGALALGGLARSVLAGRETSPNARDAKRAARAIAATAPQGDEQAPPPEPGLVGGNGVVEPAERETKVAPQVTGVIAGIRVAEGEQVKRGEPLVELESGPERAALQAADADVQEAQAELDRTLHGQRQEEIDAAVADSEAAEARALLSRGVLERTEQNAQGGAATVDELDRARRQAAADEAALRSAQARRKQAEDGSRSEDIALARAKLAAAVGHRAQAHENLARLTVRAPQDGEILSLKVRPGEYAAPGGDPLLLLGDTSRLRVRMDVDERDVGKLRVGAAAFVTADTFREKRFPGAVAEIGRRMGRKNVRTDDPIERIDTKILEVVIQLADPAAVSGERLVPGQRVMAYVEAR